MVIRIITCHHAFNHGAMLQAFALAKYLQSLGHDVRAIDYSPYYMSGISKVDFHWVSPRYNYWGVKSLYRLAKLKRNRLEQKRLDALETFYKNYIPVTQTHYSSIDELKKNPPEADLYIAGSDQIWNTTFQNGKDPAYYLDFGSPVRRISYAASFATDVLEEGTEDFVKQSLKNFDAISVREESGLELLRSMNYEGQVVVDPVFLLSEDVWSLFDTPFSLTKEKYILAYDFEYKNNQMGRLVRRIAKQRHCKIYSVSPFEKKYADKSVVDIGPDQFVSMIRNADCVISNSFHGSAFSILYEKDFFVVNRIDGLNVRMRDLLNRYELSHRLINTDSSDEVLLAPIDYKVVSAKLSHDILMSKLFLQHQLELIE